MTLDEKIGQLNQLFFLSQLMKPEMMEPDIREGKVGSLLFVTDPVLINRFQKVAVEQSRLKIPLLFGFDVIHGFRTVFPVPLAMASSWDPAMVERAQTIAAREARAAASVGRLRRWWTLRDPRWGRIVEGAGEDPYLGADVRRAGARLSGIGPVRSGPLACVKHCGYGAADGGRDYDSAHLSDAELYNVYLPPFKQRSTQALGQ